MIVENLAHFVRVAMSIQAYYDRSPSLRQIKATTGFQQSTVRFTETYINIPI